MSPYLSLIDQSYRPGNIHWSSELSLWPWTWILQSNLFTRHWSICTVKLSLSPKHQQFRTCIRISQDFIVMNPNSVTVTLTLKIARSKHKKVQTNAYLFLHGHTLCKFSGKSPFEDSYPFFALSGLQWCITILGLLTKGSAIHKISSKLTSIEIFNLGCDIDLEHSNPIFLLDKVFLFMMFYRQIEFGYKRVISLELINNIVDTIIFWLYKPTLWPWPWR